jgi:glyoxylase-like metal-dependent hydrolase (beta-lactamase superfamily II)
MQIAAVLPGLTRIDLGRVNVYLVEAGDGVVLVDTGFPGELPAVLDALRSVGRDPAELLRIVVTHAHPDHVGSAGEIAARTGVPVEMHPAEADLVRRGETKRTLRPFPGLGRTAPARMMRPFPIDPLDARASLHDGELVPGTDDLLVVAAPGHAAGQVALLWQRHGGVLLAADAVLNVGGLGLPLVVEDAEAAVRSVRRLAALEFEVAVFGHGPPIMEAAAEALGAFTPSAAPRSTSAPRGPCSAGPTRP